MSEMGKAVVVGAGPVGCVLAMVLSERGFEVDLHEKRSDMRRDEVDAGRSINLVLTDRGLRAMELLGLREQVLELTVPVLGRMMHDLDGELTYQPYGKDDSECNYSISRSELNKFVLTQAEARGVRVHFEHELARADFEAGRLWMRGADGEEIEVDAPVVFGADGAGSAVRNLLVAQHEGFEQEISWLSHGYKELTFPAGEDGSYQMADHALHIWPRGEHMLMGLANLDGSFTGTIYLPMEGEDSFEQLDGPEAVRAYFERNYPDSLELLPELEEEYFQHPVGRLGTLRCAPWHLDARVLLVGDAAHAIVPFFGQGLNCGLEDCAELYGMLEGRGPDELGEVFATFDEERKPNGDAIADMALDNFVEMSERVGDERFLLRKKFERRIEQELGSLYRSRYATVMYSSNRYRDALDAGVIQRDILAALMDEYDSPEEMDLERARELIGERLTPFYEERGVTLDF